MRPAFYVVTSIAAVLIGVYIGNTMNSTEPGLSRDDVSSIVESTLMEKPEILMRAAQAMQAKQQKQQASQGREAALKLQDVIFGDASPSTGDMSATAAVAEFFDYQCGHCQTMFGRMQAFKQKHPNVRIVYKELPIFGGNSIVAAQAALAANMQGSYSQMHAALMELGEARNLNEETIMNAAMDLGLDVTKLKADMESAEVQKELNSNRQLAQSLGFRGTPAFVVRGPGTDNQPELLYGAIPASEIERRTVSNP